MRKLYTHSVRIVHARRTYHTVSALPRPTWPARRHAPHPRYTHRTEAYSVVCVNRTIPSILLERPCGWVCIAKAKRAPSPRPYARQHVPRAAARLFVLLLFVLFAEVQPRLSPLLRQLTHGRHHVRFRPGKRKRSVLRVVMWRTRFQCEDAAVRVGCAVAV